MARASAGTGSDEDAVSVYIMRMKKITRILRSIPISIRLKGSPGYSHENEYSISLLTPAALSPEQEYHEEILAIHGSPRTIRSMTRKLPGFVH